MTKKIFFLLGFLTFLLILFPRQVQAASSPSVKFATLVYPVRGRNLWRKPDIAHVDNLLSFLNSNQLPSTWLLQYDALVDQDLVNHLKGSCHYCEFGIFLEVSGKFATDAEVSYNTADNDWARPDKVFLSGYKLLERERLVNTAFNRFRADFGHFPESIGVWYLDPYSLSFIKNRYPVTAYVSVADQYDTDAQRYWGKPWGTPFYPQKYDLLAPANNTENKLDIVEIQWAQREPTSGFGNGIWFSQHSLQANDIKGVDQDENYFERLAHVYLSQTPFGQITVGLEAGQELYDFESEHLKQLNFLLAQRKLADLQIAKVSDFARWYRQKFPKFSPTTTVTDGVTTWISSKCFRLGFKNSENNQVVVDDLRPYPTNLTSPDYVSKDGSRFLSREILAMIDGLNVNSVKETGTLSAVNDYSFNLGNKIYDFSESCQRPVNNAQVEKILLRNRMVEMVNRLLSIFKTSTINGRRIIGVQTATNTLLGVEFPHRIGFYTFPFQVLTKFSSPKI